MVFVESGINSEKDSLMRSICIENYISVLKLAVLIAMLVLNSRGLNSRALLYPHLE